MATRWYPDPINVPDVSPNWSSTWDQTSVRRKLTIDTPGNNGDRTLDGIETSATPHYHGIRQFISEPLDSISATLPVVKAAFLCSESNVKLNGVLVVIIRKCDSDGSNDTDIAVCVDDVEFDSDITNRFLDAGNQADQSFSQGDRLIFEVGFYANNTKDTSYSGTIKITDNHATTDLGENDTDTTAYNSWIETGDTFTEAASGPTGIDEAEVIAVIESVEVDLQLMDPEASTADLLSLTETITAKLGLGPVNVFDGLTITENVDAIVGLGPFAFDLIGIEENVAGFIDLPQISAFEIVALSEDISTAMDALPDLEIDIFDGVAVSESPNAFIDLAGVNVADQVALS